MTAGFKHVYGPVPSRRLGRSLGVDLVPFKTCTYDCIYCQLGRTTNLTIRRKEYVSIERVLSELKSKLGSGPAPEYITLAGSGEPTLNSRLGDLVSRIKDLTRIPVAVLTNGSLLWMSEVQNALMKADLVIPSLDAVDEALFQYVNRPHPKIAFARMTEGLAEFTERFGGEVWLEVFLLAGVTEFPVEVKKIAALVKIIHPARVQLNTISRPPAEEWAFALPEDQLRQLRRLIPGKVEVISEREPAVPPSRPVPGVTDGDILALLSRRPCTVQGVAIGLGLNPGEAVKRLAALSKRRMVQSVRSDNDIFYKIAGSK